MHIPSEMLSTPVCSVSAFLAMGGVATAAATLLRKRATAPSALKFALVSAVVFGVQMLNYPIFDGISGHLIGGVFASALLGVPAGVLAISLVLGVQTLLFSDGGLTMLGANVLTMAVVGAGLGGWLRTRLLARGLGPAASTGLAAAASVELAVITLAVLLAASGKATVASLGVLIGVHTLLALIEGVGTVVLVKVCAFEDTRRASKAGTVTLSAVLLGSIALSPFASAFPDAFEWSMDRFHLLPDAPNFVHAPFADYAVGGVTSALLSGYLAAGIGVLAVLAIGYLLAIPVCQKSGA